MDLRRFVGLGWKRQQIGICGTVKCFTGVFLGQFCAHFRQTRRQRPPLWSLQNREHFGYSLYKTRKKGFIIIRDQKAAGSNTVIPTSEDI